MTLHIADIAEHQENITPAQLWTAGMDGLNIKVSHGLSQHTVHKRTASYVQAARQGGKLLSSFHWLTGDADGAAQARYAYRNMTALGLHAAGHAHVVDIEATDGSFGRVPTQDIYQDYVTEMVELLGRPIITYTGDWWQKAHGWLIASADRSPWLWAAPNPGYQPAYPGDASPLWDAGYGGWATLAVMQYRVAPIAGIKVSQSAVRSADLWADMTGVERVASWVVVPCLLQGKKEFDQVAPNRDRGADGTIGDPDHADRSSDHNPDETGKTPQEDADSKNEVRALDIDCTGPWPDGKGGQEGGWFDRKMKAIAAAQRVLWLSTDDKCWLQNIIWRGEIAGISSDWKWVKYNGSNQHFDHAHFSARAITSCENDTRPWGVLEDEMTKTEFMAWMTEWAKSEAGKVALGKALIEAKTGNKAYPGRDEGDLAGDLHAFLDDFVGDGKGAAVRPTKPGSLGELLRELVSADVPTKLAEIQAVLDAGPSK